MVPFTLVPPPVGLALWTAVNVLGVGYLAWRMASVVPGLTWPWMGDVLQGVRYQGDRGATTESLVMRSRSGTVRRVSARHDRSKLRTLSGVRYG